MLIFFQFKRCFFFWKNFFGVIGTVIVMGTSSFIIDRFLVEKKCNVKKVKKKFTFISKVTSPIRLPTLLVVLAHIRFFLALD